MCETESSPIHSSQKCILRRWRASDAQSLAEAADNPQVVKWLSNAFAQPYTLEAAQNWISACLEEYKVEPWSFALISPQDGSVLGGIGVKPSGDIYARSKELGYWLRESAWGRGIMPDATKGYVHWFFNEHAEQQRIWAKVMVGNSGSERSLKKAGFLYEGTMRKMVWKHNQPFDESVWALTRDDFENTAIVADS